MDEIPQPTTSLDDVVRMDSVRFRWPGKRSFSLTIEEFRLHKGERLFLSGPSGNGKSTFLSLLAGIVTPQTGRIQILDTDIAQLRGGARDRFRAEHFGILFQMFNLLPYGSVIDNVVLPLSFAPLRKQRAQQGHGMRAEAMRLLESLQIEKAFVDAGTASDLSVGQQQRVAAARALIGAPELIIADEPTSALDRNRQQAFLDLLFDDVAKASSTLIMVSHDESLANRFSRVVKLEDIAKIERESAI